MVFKGDASALKDCTLVLPAVSNGNIGQLAIDMLVNTGLVQVRAAFPLTFKH
jgi:hypothetical protein